ncbi:MAG TPA: hypothetical protein CFH81_01220 [Sulfurovum sp. UBA12169]|nr:MAG TPA: hypothetical protein CFH81_01220 [Sulfurovum sp. UBA12169]
MTISDIEFEMKINDVDDSDIAAIIEVCKIKGFSAEGLDEELVKRGYEKIFTVNYDDTDEDREEDWEDFE